jgi:hypothetical protein
MFTALQARINSGKWQEFVNGFPRGGGGTYHESYTHVIDWLKTHNVSEKDVLSALINTFNLELNTQDKITTFANMFHTNDGYPTSSYQTIVDWLRNKVMAIPLPLVAGPMPAPAASGVFGKIGNWFRGENTVNDEEVAVASPTF